MFLVSSGAGSAALNLLGVFTSLKEAIEVCKKRLTIEHDGWYDIRRVMVNDMGTAIPLYKLESLWTTWLTHQIKVTKWPDVKDEDENLGPGAEFACRLIQGDPMALDILQDVMVRGG